MTLPLDEISAGAASACIGAFGLRKLRSAYASNAIRAEKSGASQQNIAFSGDDFDGASLISWAAGESARVDTWYDQSVAGSNATQTTFADQPQVGDSGGSTTLVRGGPKNRPGVRFNGTSNYLIADAIATALAAGTEVTGFAVFHDWTGTGLRCIWSTHASDDANLLLASNTGPSIDYFVVDATVKSKAVATHGGAGNYSAAVTYRSNGSSHKVSCGLQHSTAGTKAITWANHAKFSIGQEWDAGATPGNFLQAVLSELLIFDTELSDADVLILVRNATQYYHGCLLSHNMGIGAIAKTTAQYRGRVAAEGADLAVEYSASSDLTGSTTTAAVTPVTGNDWTAAVNLSSLTPGTTYYYSPVVDGVREYASPFPRFKTAPNLNTEAIKVCFGSCHKFDQTEANIFASVLAEAPNFLIHLGDFDYVDSTVLVDLRNGYYRQYRTARAYNLLENIIEKMAVARVFDNHDGVATGDVANKANALQAFKEFNPYHTLANAANGLWRSFEYGPAEFFILDSRYQREGTTARFPAAGTNTADVGSTGTQLILRLLDVPSVVADFYNGYYVKLEGVLRRVIDYDQTSRTCTLNESVPGLDSSTNYSMKRASMLDQDFIASDQVDWLIAGVNASTKSWKVICSAVSWNPTDSTASQGGWGLFDSEDFEQLFLAQEITADDIIIISADMHCAAIDDGTNSPWPEIMASPFAQAALTTNGTWSHGKGEVNNHYGVLELTRTAATLTVKDASGATQSGITPLTLAASSPEASDVSGGLGLSMLVPGFP